MQFNEFTNFLEGFLFDKNRDLSAAETKVIKDKLNSCFTKVTPNLSISNNLMPPPILPQTVNPLGLSNTDYMLVDNGNLPSGMKFNWDNINLGSQSPFISSLDLPIYDMYKNPITPGVPYSC